MPPRFGKVTDSLYRGGQPSLAFVAELNELGVKTIINLRREDGATRRAEQREAERLGMRFFHFPFYGIFGASRRFLDAVLVEVARPDNGVVYVHCKNGADRTSLVVGSHRVAHHGWSAERAWRDEFVAYGHDPDNPPSVWTAAWKNFFYRNVQRAFLRYAGEHEPG